MGLHKKIHLGQIVSEELQTLAVNVVLANNRMQRIHIGNTKYQLFQLKT